MEVVAVARPADVRTTSARRARKSGILAGRDRKWKDCPAAAGGDSGRAQYLNETTVSDGSHSALLSNAFQLALRRRVVTARLHRRVPTLPPRFARAGCR